MLSDVEREAVERAKSLLDRTEYDDPETIDQRVRDARALARALLELADALEAERSVRAALKTRCDTQQELLGARVFEAMGQSLKSNGNGHHEASTSHDDEP